MKVKAYVAQYKAWLENPPTVYEGVPEGVSIPANEAALVATLQAMLKEGVALIKARCGKNPTTSASMAVIKELEHKFTKFHEQVGDPNMKPSAFLVYLAVAQPEVAAEYLKRTTPTQATGPVELAVP